MATKDWYHPRATGGDMTSWEYARYLAFVGHSVSYFASHCPGAAAEEIVDGIRVIRKGAVLSQWLHAFLYYWRHGRGNYDVVVTEGFGGSRIPRFAPLYVKEPIVTEWFQIHKALFANQYPKALVPALNLLERITAFVHRDTLIHGLTEEWRESLPRVGFRKESVFVVPVSIRDEWLSGAKAGGVTEPRISWLGVFRRYKCPHHAVQAMRQVLEHVPDAHLTLAGRHDDLAYEERLRRLVEELGLTSNVTFRFNVSEQEKRELLQGSRVMVVPSSVEGFGIVVLEANACGMPVVASSGVPESVVRDGFNGLRYRFGEIGALSAAIVRLLEDGEAYHRLSANGLAFVKQFEWSRVGAQYEQVLREAASGGQRQPDATA